MATRRPMGSLEDDVMDYLWALGDPATPSEVRDTVAPELAYTTVNTVLTRLWEKGRLDRFRQGRSFRYAATSSEAQHRARVMTDELDIAGDRQAVLSRFVEGLGPDDVGALRSLLRRRG